MQGNDLINYIFVNGHSYLAVDRLRFLYELGREETLPEGAIVECGVCNGGTLAIISALNRRQVYGFDSWLGCPPPSEKDGGAYESVHPETGICHGNIERVEHLLFDICMHPKDRFSLVRGWIEKTLPEYRERIGKIALLHLDVDFYAPTKFVLDTLYDNVAEGGKIFCGDYGYWLGANEAIHEFCCGKPITLDRPFKNGVLWTKERWRRP